MLRPTRDIVRLEDTNRVEGIMLEGIPFTSYGTQPGIGLVHKEWENIYLLKERPGWTSDDYFTYAKKQFVLLNIEKP